MTSVLTAVRERFAKFRETKAASYDELVQSAVDGKEVKPERLSDLLAANGKGLGDFERDVERIASRIEARVKIEEAEKLQASVEAASNKSRIAMDELERIEAKAKADIADARSRFATAVDEQGIVSRQISTLRNEASETLTRTADPSLQAEIDQIDARLRDLHYEQSTVGRSPHCDKLEVQKTHAEFNSQYVTLNARIEELRQQQIA